MGFARKFKRDPRRFSAKPPEKEAKPDPPANSIELVNPVSEFFGAFIFANATYCTEVVQEGSAKGRTLAICGAGPSLAETIKDYAGKVDDIWGCNSAAMWLHDQGYPVTHAFTVDQTPHMVSEWYKAPDLTYLCASSVHPHLTEFLRSQGRRIVFFHNWVGIKRRPVEVIKDWETVSDRSGAATAVVELFQYEDWLYSAIYPSTVRVGSGLNATTRAFDLAMFMGYDQIYMLGADCALRVKSPPPEVPFGSPEHVRWLNEDTIMHADGSNALRSDATPVTMHGVIDGRLWVTKPDMAITAVWLARMARAFKRLHLVGDTLPAALVNQSDEFLDRLPHLTDPLGNPIQFDVTLQGGYELID